MDFKQIKKKLFESANEEEARNKKMMLLMPVLAIVFVFVLTRAFKKPASCSAANVQTGKTPAVVQAAENLNWPVPDLYPRDMRDPMTAGYSVSDIADFADFIVKGIVYSTDKPSAIINEKVIHEGDNVLGAVIKKINRKNVEFETDGKKWIQPVEH